MIDPRPQSLLVPARINLLGAWSDQLEWDRPAAVVNAAVGWELFGWQASPYPFRVDASGFRSAVHGIGTGLGISSIKVAAEYLYRQGPGYSRGLRYVQEATAWEAAQGTKGGWQDPVGAVEGGFKLVETTDHLNLKIQRRDDHPLLQHIVLFDTGIRRESGPIGAQVRGMFGKGLFSDSLSEIVKIARKMFHSQDPLRSIEMCLAAWRILVGYVPEMRVEVPVPKAATGYMLVGAGGGGWGVMFVREPQERGAVCADLKGRGLSAYLPILLDGARWSSDDFRRSE